MKVLIVSLWQISETSIGGTERYVIDLASNLKDSGANVDVLMMSGQSKCINNVNYYSLNDSNLVMNEYSIKNEFFSTFNLHNLQDFGNYLNSNFDVSKYDLIHLNSLLFYKAFEHKKRVFTLHENPFEFDHGWGEGSTAIISQIVSDKSNNNIFITPSKHYSLLYQNILNQNIETIPHSIDKNRLKSEKTKPQILKEINIDESFIFLLPSRMEIIQKRQDLALSALILLKKEINSIVGEFQVVFTGLDDQYRHNIIYLENLSKQSGIICSFINFKSINDAFQITDCVLLPSKSESFGYAALEALSLSLPTVLSDIPPFKEIAEGNDNALISNGDVANFGTGILTLLKNRKLHYKNSISWENRYNQSEWVKKYLQIYNSLLK
jgi:glycosyltransferase involved in cell wall biosynthesis